MNLTGWSSDRVLYIGDHVYMDLAVSASVSASAAVCIALYPSQLVKVKYAIPFQQCRLGAHLPFLGLETVGL